MKELRKRIKNALGFAAIIMSLVSLWQACENQETAVLYGIDVSTVFAGNWTMCMMLAMAFAIIIAPLVSAFMSMAGIVCGLLAITLVVLFGSVGVISPENVAAFLNVSAFVITLGTVSIFLIIIRLMLSEDW